MTCFSIVIVLHSLNRLFSLVVLLIMYCVVKSHFMPLFMQKIKKKKRMEDCRPSPAMSDEEFERECIFHAPEKTCPADLLSE